MERTIVINQLTRREVIEDEIIYLRSLRDKCGTNRPDSIEACKVSETIVMLLGMLKLCPIYYSMKIDN